MTEKEPNTPVASQVQSRRRLGSRAALFAGFGALLIMMAIICIDSLHTLEAFQTNNTQIRQDFLYRERTLEQVRAGLYESGNIMRDYILIESDPDPQQMLRTELQTIHNETTSTLNACIQSLPTAKGEPFQHLAATEVMTVPCPAVLLEALSGPVPNRLSAVRVRHERSPLARRAGHSEWRPPQESRGTSQGANVPG